MKKDGPLVSFTPLGDTSAHLHKDKRPTYPKLFDTPSEMKKTIADFNLCETDAEKQGLFSLALLMKGNFVPQLTQLLEESDTPINIKLLICDFLVDSRIADVRDVVEKTLMEICHIGTNESHTNMKKKSTTLHDTI